MDASLDYMEKIFADVCRCTAIEWRRAWTERPDILRIVFKQLLHHTFLERTLAAGEEVDAGVFADAHVRS